MISQKVKIQLLVSFQKERRISEIETQSFNNKDNDLIWDDSRLSPLYTSQSVIYIICLVENITENKKF